MRQRIIFIHGNGGGTGSDNWFPWCAEQLASAGFAVDHPNFPDPLLARANRWLSFLHDQLKADKEAILVGHSSGAVAAMRYAEHHQLFGSVLVGASYTDLGDNTEKVSGYFKKPWDWDAIKHNQRWIIHYASSDDPYIPISEARFIHEQLGTEYYESTDQGHFGSGKRAKTEFPELVRAVLDKIS